MTPRPRVSIVLATHNRRDVVTHTLDVLAECGLDRTDYESIVVDNASTDGTAEAINGRPGVHVIRLDHNRGSCAKAAGAERATGSLIVFLDDDARPRPGALEMMIRHFERNAVLGAAGFTVHLSDGTRECSALPHVFVGCGVGFRARALRGVGGLDASFFMQAEEYDLSFRLLNAGWRVEAFADLHVDHLKTPAARQSARTAYYDVRNNLRVIGRYLPPPFRAVYHTDWLQRYRWLAERNGHASAFRRGVLAGRLWRTLEQNRFRTQRLSATTLESVFCWADVRMRMEQLRGQGYRRILLADLGKNVFAFHRGAAEAGLNVTAIADDRFAAVGRTYRGTPVVPTREGLSCRVDAVVVSNTSYVHAEARAEALARATALPVFNWFDSPGAELSGEVGSTITAHVADVLTKGEWRSAKGECQMVAAAHGA